MCWASFSLWDIARESWFVSIPAGRTSCSAIFFLGICKNNFQTVVVAFWKIVIFYSLPSAPRALVGHRATTGHGVSLQCCSFLLAGMSVFRPEASTDATAVSPLVLEAHLPTQHTHCLWHTDLWLSTAQCKELMKLHSSGSLSICSWCLQVDQGPRALFSSPTLGWGGENPNYLSQHCCLSGSGGWYQTWDSKVGCRHFTCQLKHPSLLYVCFILYFLIIAIIVLPAFLNLTKRAAVPFPFLAT